MARPSLSHPRSGPRPEHSERTRTRKPAGAKRKRGIRKTIRILGVDLAGVEHRPTGMCLLRGLRAKTFLLYGNKDILACIKEERPGLVAIDAPLMLPPGRRSMDDRNNCHLRPADEELLRRRIPFFPITLGPMRALTERGIFLKKKIEALEVRVVEIYPGGAQDVWNIPRAKRNIRGLKQGLERLGILELKKDASDHELDAASGALVGRLFLQGKAEVYGDFATGAILMPPRVRPKKTSF